MISVVVVCHMARNDALASGHTVINAVIINFLSYFIYVTEKLSVGDCLNVYLNSAGAYFYLYFDPL